MTARHSVRGTVKAELVKRIKAAGAARAKVQVETDWPGNALENESIYMPQCTGRVTMPVTNAGRRMRNDEFVVTIVVQAGKAGQTRATAVARAEVMLSWVEDALAEDPGLGGIDGLGHALQGTTEGPDTFPTKTGAVAFFTVEVDCLARYY